MSEIVPLMDVLFVFESWTLMVDSKLDLPLRSGGKVDLLDAAQSKIGEATIVRTLASRKPEVSAFAISVQVGPDDLKAAKFVRAAK